MAKRGFGKVPAVLAACGLALALVLTGCPADLSPDTGFTVSPDNNTNTTVLNFVFNSNVPDDLTEYYFDVVSASDAAVFVGTLSGRGRARALEVSASRTTEVLVTILRNGISSMPQSATVYAYNTPDGITWTANLNQASPATGASTDSVIDFLFSRPVVGLTIDNINVESRHGEVTLGELTGNGRNWSMGVTVDRDGDVYISIDMVGIISRATRVPVSKIVPNITFNAEESEILIRLSRPVSAPLTADQIAVTPVTATFGLGTLTGSGAEWRLPITVTRTGHIAVSVNRPGFALSQQASADNPNRPSEMTVAMNTLRSDLDGVAPYPTGGVTTRIHLNFVSPVSDLTAGQVSLTFPGAVVPVGLPTLAGDLQGHGRNWSIAVTAPTVAGFGTSPIGMSLSINRNDVSPASRSVTITRPTTGAP